MARVSKPLLRTLYAVFIALLVTVSLFVLNAILTTRDTQRESHHLLDYRDIHRFDPLREGGHLLPNIDGWMKGVSRGFLCRRYADRSAGDHWISS